MSYVFSVATTVWLDWAARQNVSLTPMFDSEYAGATLTGRF